MLSDIDKAVALKERLRRGDPTIGAQLTLTDSTVVEIFGRAGYDWAVIDTEHAAQSQVTVKSLLQAASSTAMVALVRLLRMDIDDVRRWLDFGAAGVLCPFVQTAEEATQLVRACRYPPLGTRGYGPRRAGGYGFDSVEYFARASDACICLVIIESRLGVENCDTILAVDGVDGVIIGPMDLSIDLGAFMDFSSPSYVEAVERVAAAAARHGKAMGTAAYDSHQANEYVGKGYTLLMVGGDDVFLMEGAKRAVDSWRAGRA